jgi:putative ABC transport system permease protein
MFQDLRYGARMLVKNPGFTVVAIFTLALGIGANTAIFSVANGVLFKPLPYKDPERLAFIRSDWRGVSGQAGIAAAEVVDFRQQSKLFEGFEVIMSNNSSLTGENMEKLRSVTVTERFLPLLGVQPFLGSLADKPGKVWDVVISYQLWQRRFGGDRRIIGRTIEVNNSHRTVLGVMPPDFQMHLGEGVNVPEQLDLFFLGSLDDGGTITDRQNHDYATIARLKPGVTFAQAQSELDAITAGLAQQHPRVYENSNLKFHLVPLHRDLVRRVKPAILALLCAVGFVLLIACANVANLVLMRTDARAKELAIRCAMGAGRRRILRQLVTENLLLALLGGAGGLLVAVWGMHLLLLLRPANLPRQMEIGIDSAALGATLFVSLLAGVALGLIPAWQALKSDVNVVLKESGRQSSRGRGHLRNGLVVVEVALSLVLLVGAGLMMRTFANIYRLDWGFNPNNVLTLQVALQPRGFPEIASRWKFYQQALEKVGAMPGVESVSGVMPLPLSGDSMISSYSLDEAAVTPLSASAHTVLPGFFRTMDTALIAGRDFTPVEIEQKLPLVIVDANLASNAWPDENPIGKKLLWRPRTRGQQWLEIIGVAEHIKAGGFRDEGMPQLYLPYQNYPLYDLALVVRGKADPLALGPTIKQEIEQMGTRRPAHTLQAMSEYVSRQSAEARFTLTLIGVLAFIALLLSLVGLYGVIAYTVSGRTHEIGIRMALGAQGRDVLRLVLGKGMAMVGLGIAAGLIGALALTRALAVLLFGVGARDPLTIGLATALLLAVAMLAGWLPARRAAQVDPLVVLRHE